jgi:predicted metal-dependent enzyme (double-stranded beta helix superfamily)
VVEKAMIKLLYKLVAMLFSMLAGVFAGTIFKKVWKIAAREQDAPQPTDKRRAWPEILLAAGLQGAIFAIVRAAVDRSAASGMHRLTGVWPGEEGQQPDDSGGPSGTA